jgi:hypothetical protein
MEVGLQLFSMPAELSCSSHNYGFIMNLQISSIFLHVCFNV